MHSGSSQRQLTAKSRSLARHTAQRRTSRTSEHGGATMGPGASMVWKVRDDFLGSSPRARVGRVISGTWNLR